MKIYSSYKVKIKHYNRIFDQTVRLYRDAVDFFIDVIDTEWDKIADISTSIRRVLASGGIDHSASGRKSQSQSD